MPLHLVEDTDIKIMKASCAAFKSGFCYSANNPFYSGHYETAGAALAAAERMKRDAAPVSQF